VRPIIPSRFSRRPAKYGAVAQSTIPTTLLGVAAPGELGDGAAHRVADRDESVDAERRSHVDGVVGAVLEPERLLRTQAGAVTAMVERDHAVVLPECSVALEPVEVGGRRPPVQQHDRGSARPGAEVAHHDRPPIGELDEPRRRQHR
jgi:hypothetical protein